MYEQIEMLVKEKGITMAALSRETGVGENILSNLKRRRGNLSIENSRKIAKYFGVSIEELIGE